ncbi:uncharacterized protein Z519_00714 [Cladophialophora bantiana CBS 173.52]|uniref:AMP-dependent synthetase/ligase domain-containing protein n=1 Tax=Cladophialophora bantiana (strain ATCC 10958 / CBS 173.52 / CDC B-1940 / NIH 8579) TaxID=1442370 RepID=A0A0D2FAE7_CLAB1|nr:uncharacterized protein Z519_00714 [Cladophialophora bantiana CBS 173.52]KIW99051.1 hypothetical protein Z519_00714 [Cladophialophora bantiana CBS 173.52]
MLQPTVLSTRISPAILQLTLNRPASLNAINAGLLEELVTCLKNANNDPDVRIIILQGSGSRSFCAGEDLKESLVSGRGSCEELQTAFEKLQDITRLTSSTNKLIVTAVQGYAVGGGAEIALAADFVIGGPNAKFKFPEVTIGHAVTGGISLRLCQMVGLLKAKELLLRGLPLDAQEALRLGLLTELVEDPKERAIQLALELEKLPAKASSCSKTGLEKAVFPNMEEVLRDEVQAANFCFAQPDAQQAFRNFRERRLSDPEEMALRDAAGGDVNTSPKGTRSILDGDSTLPKDLNAVLQIALQEFPQRTFIRFEGRDTSFQQFTNSVAQLAGGLRHLGVGPGDRLLVMMRNSLETVHTWFATNRLGATWVPVNVELKSITLQHVVSSVRPKLAIVDAEFVSHIEGTKVFSESQIYVKNGVNSDENSLSALYHLGRVEDAVPVLPSTPAAFLYTSGTTGPSKPCILSHQYFILQATALIEGFGLRQDDVLYCPFPLFHVDATALTTVPALLLGATAAFSVRFSASRFWDEIRVSKATVYDFMGATLALVYKQEPNPQDRNHNVRLAWGVPIPDFGKDYEQRFGHPLLTLYGSTEASLPIMQKGATLPVGSCGRLRPGFYLRIANDFDEPLPANTPGQLLLRSEKPNAFFQGYYGNDESTLRSFANLWFHTGDLAKVDEHGNVYFLGRIKDVIRRRGENVNAAEVEAEFLKHPAVAAAAAFGIPSALGGAGTEEDVKVTVELRAAEKVSEAELWRWATANMARFQVPSVIQIVPVIKKTPTGKVEKQALTVEGGQRFGFVRESKL